MDLYIDRLLRLPVPLLKKTSAFCQDYSFPLQ